MLAFRGLDAIFFITGSWSNGSDFLERILTQFNLEPSLFQLSSTPSCNKAVHMCPPSLVLLPYEGTPRAAFIGARTPSLIAKLKGSARKRQKQALLSHVTQNKGNINVPASIVIDAVDKKTLADIAGDAGIGIDLDEPAAWKLANFSVSAKDIEESLRFEQRQEPNWNRKIFRKAKLVFSGFGHRNPDSLDLAEYINPINQQRRHWLWKGGLSAEVERDWGRYVVLSYETRDIVLYDEKVWRLAFPVTVPLPCILCRALALCSGKIPVLVKIGESPVASIPEKHPVLIYTEVPPDIAALVAGKLGQNLFSVSLGDVENGMSI